jgi:hypothetical protein
MLTGGSGRGLSGVELGERPGDNMNAQQIIDLANETPFAFMQVGFVPKGEPYTDPLDAWIDRSGSRFPESADELEGLSDDALDTLIRTVEQDSRSNDAAASFIKGERVMDLARALAQYRAERRIGRQAKGISHGQARRLASEWHGGQWSALYSLSSTGAIDVEAADREIMASLDLQPEGTDDERDLDALLAYVHSHGPRGPVADDGWTTLWDDTPVEGR